MCAVRKPIIRSYEENAKDYNTAVKNLKCIVDDIDAQDDKEAKLLLESPVVYIHTWEKENKCNVYIGETNNFEKRTKQHYEAGSKQNLKKKDIWQKEIYEHSGNLFLIGHEHFNKSLTLDVENKLIEYIIASPNDLRKRNGRGNPQDSYYPDEEFDEIFNKIWLGLHNNDNKTFVKASEIHKSAIYKASPLKKLNKGQKKAKEKILNAINNALINNEKKQLVFIEGEAGTGKTVVMSSAFYEFYSNCVDFGKKVKCCLIVNHHEQLVVYKQIMKRLGYDAEEIVFKPVTFINRFGGKGKEPVDVVFVDEAHLLLTQGNQGYSTKKEYISGNQLDDIMNIAKITVAMYDEWQNLSAEQYRDVVKIQEYRQLAVDNDSHVELKQQLRITASPLTLDWIDSITKDKVIKNIPMDSKYDIRVYDSPVALEKAIQDKAKNAASSLSRLVATYDWEFNGVNSPKELNQNDDRECWGVNINGWWKPWNYELCKSKNKELAWAEQPHTLGEIGSTYTIQGFDLNYVGVILGPSVKYRDGKIVFDPSASKNRRATQKRTLDKEKKVKQSFGEMFLQHEFKVLMTRGVNGLYIYACDDELREALLKAQHPKAQEKYAESEHMMLLAAENHEKYGK